MKKDLELWYFVLAKLKNNDPVVLLVVAESSGSSPGRQGFKMAVSGDDLRGSIGGGVMEVALVEQARKKLRIEPNQSKIQNPKSKIEMVHRKDSPDSSGMICSGRQTVVFFELKNEHLETVREIVGALEDQQPKVLRISSENLEVLDVSGEKPPKGGTPNFDFWFEPEDEFVFEERLGFKNRLFIVGGGHCALALSELMSRMEFYISLFDDRPDLNTLAKNEFVHSKTIIDSYGNIGEYISSGENHYVVVMTLGYKFDEIVIRKLFDKTFKYFGVLGSAAKMATLLRALRKDGFDALKLNKIHTPVGLTINSQTPEEIAVSIAAEIIAIKNGASV